MKTALILAAILLGSPRCLLADKLRLSDIPEPSARKKQSDDPMTPEERRAIALSLADEFYQKGSLALAQGKRDQARLFFARSLAVDPANARARRALESLAAPRPPSNAEKARLAKASSEKKLMKEFDQEVAARRFHAATAIGQRILEINPRNARVQAKLSEIRDDLFWTYVQKGREEEKAGNLSRSIDFYRESLRYRDDAEVRSVIERITRQRAQSERERSEDLYRAALSANLNGNLRQAIEFCRRSLELDPQNIHAQRMLDRLKAKHLD